MSCISNVILIWGCLFMIFGINEKVKLVGIALVTLALNI